ncbi:acyltransferase [Pseudidiomarina aestuarii]|uniref:Acyltransferase n=1 Tax=Pseudidiomarina aestuarii TaxID=624146 RepID=A0A2T4D5S4_9GAMM|nr:acyltransferase [Pseudidiomarina aestuarii]PTB86714.1 acyltransferase [Pseudidiomarina aestuarii]PTB88642.1 acyltransferase [Pseudidiomarina aestuarii]PTB89161.1 acyltransferase [Pseudidiomarina aestuarii]
MKKIIYLILMIGHPILLLFYSRWVLRSRHFQNVNGYIWAYKSIFWRNILRYEKPTPWPAHASVRIAVPQNLIFHQDDINNFQSFGCYYQNYHAQIILGKGTFVAPNCGFITADHSLDDLNSSSTGANIVIGENCWIGMNSMILKGVNLADNTVVAAGTVVTKSFTESRIIIAGVPAKIIKRF